MIVCYCLYVLILINNILLEINHDSSDTNRLIKDWDNNVVKQWLERSELYQ